MPRRAPIVVLIGGSVFAAIAIWASGVLSEDGDKMTKFERAIWTDEAASYAEPYPRFDMAQDLLSNELVAGTTRDAVVALLGPATDTPYFADRGLVYWLSQSRSGLGVDSHWLVIDFDDDGMLTLAEIVRD